MNSFAIRTVARSRRARPLLARHHAGRYVAQFITIALTAALTVALIVAPALPSTSHAAELMQPRAWQAGYSGAHAPASHAYLPPGATYAPQAAYQNGQPIYEQLPPTPPPYGNTPYAYSQHGFPQQSYAPPTAGRSPGQLTQPSQFRPAAVAQTPTVPRAPNPGTPSQMTSPETLGPGVATYDPVPDYGASTYGEPDYDGSTGPVYGDSPFQEPWQWVVLPSGIIYQSYLASVREARLGSVWNHTSSLGGTWDIALGGKAGLIRYGTMDGPRPEGWQLDVDGVAFPRLDMANNCDLSATDYRAGLALTQRRDRWGWKFGGYHLSSHIGDEYLLRNPGFQRINYSRNALLLGTSYWPINDLRLYGEAGWAFDNDGGSEPWEFQFGVDYSPLCSRGFTPAPFFAINGHLREEVDYGGQLVVQSGLQWRSMTSTHLFRFGGEYYNGKSRQLELYNNFEQQVGLGIWYDF